MLTALLLAAAVTGPVNAPASNDYGLEQNWLCRPGRRDACTINRDISEIAADGSVKKVAFEPVTATKVDCFYVYPTVSYDATGNSDMVANDEERQVISAQFAQFGSVCRQFAPLYRQVTLTALRAVMAGQAMAADRELNYADVRDAWNHYLAHDNGGRPFILIGHSQGSGLLKRLVQEEIEGKPVAGRMLSAMLAGTNVAVAKGKDVGGDFKTAPLCRKADQTGCIIAFVSFRDTAPPPSNSRFGRTSATDKEIACTNPAALGGGIATLGNLFPTTSSFDQMRKNAPWTSAGAITTPYAVLPGLLSGGCQSVDGANFLAVHVNADPKDPRTDEIAGDVVIGTYVAKDWGLHLIDVNIVHGDMIRLVMTQSAAWAKKPGASK